MYPAVINAPQYDLVGTAKAIKNKSVEDT